MSLLYGSDLLPSCYHSIAANPSSRPFHQTGSERKELDCCRLLLHYVGLSHSDVEHRELIPWQGYLNRIYLIIK